MPQPFQPSTARLIAFYRRLGYTETEPYATESPVPMIYLERLITARSAPG